MIRIKFNLKLKPNVVHTAANIGANNHLSWGIYGW